VRIVEILFEKTIFELSDVEDCMNQFDLLVAGRDIVLYGAGHDARITFGILMDFGVDVAFCVARENGRCISWAGRTIPVNSPEVLDSSLHFVIVASSLYHSFMEAVLRAKRLELNKDYVVWTSERGIPYLLESSDVCCAQLSRRLSIGERTVSFCCAIMPQKNYSSNVPTLRFDLNDDIDDVANTIIETRRSWAKTPPKFCSVCKSRTEGVFYPRIREIGIGFYPALCNFRCIYCSVARESPHLLRTNNSSAMQFITSLVCSLRKMNMLSAALEFSFASGEISVNGFSQPFLELVGDACVTITTNASVFDEAIAQKLTDGVSSIIVSLDSGTRETFAKIRGVDRFEKVCRNLKRYKENGKVVLKYILLPGFNDTESDYEGIARLLNDLGLQDLVITCDFNVDSENHDVALELVCSRLSKYGIRPWKFLMM
jgi:pyruvate-formate lyase-activating enzyme